MDSWVCEVSGSQLWLYKTNSSWLERETPEEIPAKITGRLLEQRATNWIREELHPETYIQKNEFGKPELAQQIAQSNVEHEPIVLPYINYSHTLILDNIPSGSSHNKEDSNQEKEINTIPNHGILTNNSIGVNSKSIGGLEKDCWVLWGINPTQPLGVDIESLRPQIEKIKSKFCRPEELEFAITPVQSLLIWSAKEAMYKAYGKKEIDFREQMRVHAFTGFSENQGLENKLKIHADSTKLSAEVGIKEISNSTESTIPQKKNSEPETIQFSGELWGDKHYQFDLFARWYEPFVVVWAVESKSVY